MDARRPDGYGKAECEVARTQHILIRNIINRIYRMVRMQIKILYILSILFDSPCGKLDT